MAATATEPTSLSLTAAVLAIAVVGACICWRWRHVLLAARKRTELNSTEDVVVSEVAGRGYGLLTRRPFRRGDLVLAEMPLS
eukprot:4364246-Prymnesium_polylepis.1